MSREVGLKSDILSTDASDLDQWLFKCRMAESAERFDDMVKCVKEVCKAAKGQVLGPNERNYLSVAYKNSVASRRAALRCVVTMRTRYESKNAALNVRLVDEYYRDLLGELDNICMDVINLVNEVVMPQSLLDSMKDDRAAREFKVFFLKINADYYRYLAEFAEGPKKKEAIEKAAANYAAAVQAATTGPEDVVLPPPHPVRLGLHLNYSVFLYEIQDKPEEAKTLAKQAFDEALERLDSAGELEYKDSTLILQLLRDNTTLWNAQDNNNNDQEKQQQDNNNNNPKEDQLPAA